MTSIRRSTVAVSVMFFVNGFYMSNWVPRINEIRDHLGVSNSGMGVALLGGGLGGFFGSMMVARIMTHVRTKTVVLVAALVSAVLVPLIAWVPNEFAFLFLMSIVGFIDTNNDVAFNAQGVMIQTRVGKPIMQRLHGTWSLGMVIGGGVGWLASAADLPLRTHLILASFLEVLVIAWAVSGLLPQDDPPEPHLDENAPGNGRPALRFAVAIGFMGFGLAMLEGTPNEWSSIVLNDVFHAGHLKGAGTIVFATAMLIGRLSGDHVRMKIGANKMFSGGVLVCLAASVVLATAPVTFVAFVAYAMWGLGVSVLFPYLYELAAKLPGVPAARGLGAMTFGQRLGFLAAVGSVGAIADLTNFRVTMFGVAALATILVFGFRSRTH